MVCCSYICVQHGKANTGKPFSGLKKILQHNLNSCVSLDCIPSFAKILAGSGSGTSFRTFTSLIANPSIYTK